MPIDKIEALIHVVTTQGVVVPTINENLVNIAAKIESPPLLVLLVNLDPLLILLIILLLLLTLENYQVQVT